MSEFHIFADKEAEALVEQIFTELEKKLGESGQRQRFMLACSRLSSNDLTILQSALSRSTAEQSLVEMAEKAERPFKIACAILSLEEMLKKTTSKKIFKFLLAMLSKPNVIRGLNRVWFGFWETPLLDNRNLSAELIRLIWSNQKDLYHKESAYPMMRFIADKPNCPADVLEDMLAYNDAGCMNRIALHKNITNHIASHFLNSARKPERMAISNSKHISKDMLLSLCNDKNPEVASSARKNIQLRFGDADISETEIAESIARHIIKPHLPPKKEQAPFFDVVSAERAGLPFILSCKDSKHRKKISESTVDHAILKELAKDSSAVVRRAVAGNRFCSDATLESLIGDEDVIVAINSLTLYLDRHPDKIAETILPESRVTTAKELVNIFINKKIRFLHADKNPKTKEEAEMELAFRIIRTTADEMLQMRVAGRINKIPEWDTLHWKLLGELSHNKNLTDRLARKLALELGFASERILENSKNPSLLSDFLALPGTPAGVRERIARHLNKLIAQKK